MSGEKKVLIIEDEAYFQKSLADKLTEFGYVVLLANDGKEGLQLALNQKPSLIILDIVMPVLDGISMFQKLRQDEWGKNANVIFLSNYLSDAEKTIGGAQNKNCIFLLKSHWQPDDITHKVKEILG